MTRVLLVANRSLGSREVSEFVRDRVAQQDTEFTLLVPALPRSDHDPTTRLAGGMSSVMYGTQEAPHEGEDSYSHARSRLEYGLDLLKRLGAVADGEVGDPDAGKAIQDVLSRRPFDEVALSTLPEGISRWLRLDIPSRVKRKFGVPVTVIHAQEGA